MRYTDLLTESNKDTNDINLASQWIAEWLWQQKPKSGNVFNVDIIKRKSGKDFPIDDGTVKQLLTGITFVMGVSPPKNDTITMAYCNLNKNIIWFNVMLATMPLGYITGTVSHELRHAVDGQLSKNKAFKKYNKDDYNEYLRAPQEINARWTQSMWQVIQVTVRENPKNPNDALNIIDDCLHNNELGRNMFNKGPKGDKQYNRLRSRAIRYWTAIYKFIKVKDIKKDDKSLLQKFKQLISQYNPFK